jgi:molybdate transport system substrate-binding protein
MRRALLALPLLLLARPAVAGPAPLVAAAADLQFALAEIAEGFRAASGHAVRLSFGSSGNIARQIEQGSPVELFLSADEAFVFRLHERGHTRDRGVLYAVGRIALLAPYGSPIRVEAGLEGVREALAAGRVTRFAIAHPEHAPYGRAAMEALQRAGLWEAIRPRLAFGENAAQAAQFALAGGSQGGIVAQSLAVALAGRGRSAPLPESLHAPLFQRMVLTRRAGVVAERFHAHLQDTPAREILRRHGFTLPGA